MGVISYCSISVRSKKWYREGLCSHGYEKKSSGPFQKRSRKWVVRKREPENGMIRYCTISYHSVFSVLLLNRKTGPVYVHFKKLFGFYGDTKLVSSNELYSGSLSMETTYFSKKWFLNQKMENYIFFKKMVFQSLYGFH